MNKISKSGLPRIFCRLVLALLLLGVCQHKTQAANARPVPIGYKADSKPIMPFEQSKARKVAAKSAPGISTTITCDMIPEESYSNYSGRYLDNNYIFRWETPTEIIYERDKTVINYSGQGGYFGFKNENDSPALEAVKIYLDPTKVNNAVVSAADMTSDGDLYYSQTEEIICDYANNYIYWKASSPYAQDNIYIYLESGELNIIGFDIYSEGNTPSDFMSGTSPDVVPAPVFSPSSCEFGSPITVEISCAPGLDIYYSTDGYLPVISEETKYNGPIVISASTNMGAISVDSKGRSSSPAWGIYTRNRYGIGEGYDPTSPGNPGDGSEETSKKKYRLTVVSNPSDFGNVYPRSQEFEAGSRVRVYCYEESGFKFSNWTIEGEEVSNQTSFYYVMPEYDVTIVGNYNYDPQSPGNPNPNEQKVKHPVTLRAIPSGSATFSSSRFDLEENASHQIYLYPGDGWKLVGWTINGEQQEIFESSFSITMGERAMDIAVYMEYAPETPGNPGSNYYNPATGQVIIDDFTPGNLYDALREVVGSDNFENVSSIVVNGQMHSNDCLSLSSLVNVEIIDLIRTSGSLSIPMYAFNLTKLSTLLLPSDVTEIKSYAFYECSSLNKIAIYSLIPPKCTSQTFGFDLSQCDLYVPESVIQSYIDDSYWGKFKIHPIVSETNFWEVSPEDPEGWNNLRRPHIITVKGNYSSTLGEECRIEYSVEDSEEWSILVDNVKSGDSFSASLIAMFNTKLPIHSINLRTVNAAGVVSMLSPISYLDVNFIEFEGNDARYYDWGEPIVQSSLTCVLPQEQYDVCGYKDNVNVGMASFKVNGVYPFTIGSRTVYFDILPLPLADEIELVEDDSYVYCGSSIQPSWKFVDDKFCVLEEGIDYEIVWRNNIYPGNASIEVNGINNFTGTLAKTFIIEKGILYSDKYSISLPGDDITFDNQVHAAITEKEFGVGDILIYYSLYGTQELFEEAPKQCGKYDVYVEVKEGELYQGISRYMVGSFTIYSLDEDDWQNIENIVPILSQKGWLNPWDLTNGVASVARLKGVSIKEGHIVGIDLSDSHLTGDFPKELFRFKSLESLDISCNDLSGNIARFLIEENDEIECHSKLKILNISNNSFSGNLGELASLFPMLISLNASYNNFTEVFPVISTTVSDLNLSNQVLDVVLELDLSRGSADFYDQIPSILLYNHKMQKYDDSIRMRCISANGWNAVLNFDEEQVCFRDFEGSNVYIGESGDELDLLYFVNDIGFVQSSMKLRLNFNYGDANFDGCTNVLDLQSTILYAFRDFDEYAFNFVGADTYKDSRINVQDVICTANILLDNNSYEESTTMNKKSISNSKQESDAYIFIVGNEIFLNSCTPVAAIDLLIDGDVDWCVKQYGLYETSTNNHLVGYSLSKMTIPSGVVKIGDLRKESKIRRCTLSDDCAQPISVSIDYAVGGCSIYSEDYHDNNKIYDLKGIQHSSIDKGINVVLENNKSKVIFKR